MREFEQMEMQFFVHPEEEMKWYDYWKKTRMEWHKNLGFDDDMHSFHDHLKPAHYANAAVDIEFKFPFGTKELEGIHSRTDYDLKSHQEVSGKKIQYFDEEVKKNYIPYVIETSLGLDRMFLSILSKAYIEESVQENGKVKERIYLKIPPGLAPVKAAVLPLLRKDGLPEKAREIVKLLKSNFNVNYEEQASIGKLYARQDLIGTPYCITVDHQTLDDNTVTVRERNTRKQRRMYINELNSWLTERVSINSLLKNLEFSDRE